MVLAIDFDGTIVTNAFPGVGKLIEGADYYIKKLYDEGHEIIINTCRSGKFEAAAHQFLEDNNIPFHYINTNLPRLIEFYKQDCRKISADIYIDDKCLMGLPNWEQIYRIINERRKDQGNSL